jgi:hypothetical protein
MGNEATARATWAQENKQEIGRCVGSSLRGCLVPGVWVSQRAYHPGQSALALHHPDAVAPSPITPPGTSQGRSAYALWRDTEPEHQAWHPDQAHPLWIDLRGREHARKAEFARSRYWEAAHPKGKTGGVSHDKIVTMEGAAHPEALKGPGVLPRDFL